MDFNAAKDHLRRVAQQTQALIEIADGLESVSALDTHIRELTVRRDALMAESESLTAKITDQQSVLAGVSDSVKHEYAALTAAAEKNIETANHRASEILAAADVEAEAIESNARGRAQVMISNAQDEVAHVKQSITLAEQEKANIESVIQQRAAELTELESKITAARETVAKLLGG